MNSEHGALSEDFVPVETSLLGSTKTVWRSGEGPGVLIMHEVPGITPPVARFARIVRDRGFTVFVPQMFGEPDKSQSSSYTASSMARVCLSKEFHVLASGKSSPICRWLRALSKQIHAELGGPGVGALGMCLTGNFALALMIEPSVRAPVLCQPSLPLPLNRSRAAGLHVYPEEVEAIKSRVHQEAMSILGLRFTHDRICPRARFDHLRQEFGAGFEAIEIDSGPGNPWHIPKSAHSVLTEELVNEEGHPTHEALHRVLSFFEERLMTPSVS